MNYIDLNLDSDLVTLFVHKPYNFKLDQTTEEERINIIKSIGSFKRVVGARQTHSNNVRIIDESNIDDTFDNVDGLITNLKEVALVTYVADCQSILLYDTKNKVIGNIHSGWKGTLTRISSNAVNLMMEKYNTNPSDIKVYISPSIHKCCFEVSEDLKNTFEEEFKDINISDLITKGEIKEGEQKYYIDTVEINKRVLNNLGVKDITVSDICSMCNSDIIHSYRKDKPNDGRNLSLICIK